MPKELKIYLFRHGFTEFNRDKRFTGHFDAKLTHEGIEQSKVIAEKLRDKEFQIAYHTSLSRSKDTLMLVLKYHPNVEIIEDDRLIERSYGDLTGKTHNWCIDTYGEEQFHIWHRSYDVPPPGGESIKMVEARVLDFIKDLLDKMKREFVNVAIAAHSNSMRPFRRYFEGFSIDEMMKIVNPFDHYFEYSVKV
ncbi:MAG: histidine phosphatase family protein [Candidatus Helarchaeota archaeon]